MEVLSQLQHEPGIPVRLSDIDVEGVHEVDDKLVILARQLHCPILTNDYNLNRIADLQGVMGREYSRHDGEKAEVALGVFEHYLPRGASDRLPQGIVGAVLGVADRADAIVGCFGVGLQPTGSADPFALRRAAVSPVSSHL